MSEADNFGASNICGIVLIAYAAINFVSCCPFVILFCLRKSLVHSLKFKFPTMAFITWLCFVIAILACGVVYAISDGEELQHKATIAILVVLYVIYFILCCVTPSFRATFRRFDVSEFDTHLQNLRNTGVDLHFDIVASHTERKTRTDSQGRTTTESHTVVTYRKTRYFPVPFWIDLTNPIVIPSVTPYIRVDVKPKVEWCHDSEKIISSINRRLYEKNKHRDANVTVTTHVGIPGIISNLLLRSPVVEPTTMQKVRVNPGIGLLLTFLGLGGHHAFILARSLPVVKHKVHKKASLVQPVVDDSWLKQYKVKGAVMTPRGTVFGNVQMVDSWDCEQSVIENYTPSQPMFVNPMPLYVTYETALQYETPTAPPMPYMYYDPTGCGPAPTAPPMEPAQSGYGPDPNAMAQPLMGQPMGQPMPGAYPPADPNAPPMNTGYDPAPQPSAPPMVDPVAYPGAVVDPNAATITTSTTTTGQM